MTVMKGLITVLLTILSLVSSSQEKMTFAQWDSLCIMYPPCSPSLDRITEDSSTWAFYSSLFERLDKEERTIPLGRYYELVMNAEDWQWLDTSFTKLTNCYECMENIFYALFVEEVNEYYRKYYDSLKDSITLNFEDDKFNKLPFDSTQATVYCAYIDVDSNVLKKICEAKITKNGFVHPGTEITYQYWYLILKYKNEYYYLNSIRPGNSIYIRIDKKFGRINVTSERTNRVFYDYYNCKKPLQFSRFNKKILKKWKKGKVAIKKSEYWVKNS